jgi:hypothetical protein
MPFSLSVISLLYVTLSCQDGFVSKIRSTILLHIFIWIRLMTLSRCNTALLARARQSICDNIEG